MLRQFLTQGFIGDFAVIFLPFWLDLSPIFNRLHSHLSQPLSSCKFLSTSTSSVPIYLGTEQVVVDTRVDVTLCVAGPAPVADFRPGTSLD